MVGIHRLLLEVVVWEVVTGECSIRSCKENMGGGGGCSQLDELPVDCHGDAEDWLVCIPPSPLRGDGLVAGDAESSL